MFLFWINHVHPFNHAFWCPHRQPITDNARTENRYVILPDGSLLIQDVTSGDAGSYSCRAYNNLGAVTQSYTLTVNGMCRNNDQYQHINVIVFILISLEKLQKSNPRGSHGFAIFFIIEPRTLVYIIQI